MLFVQKKVKIVILHISGRNLSFKYTKSYVSQDIYADIVIKQ